MLESLHLVSIMPMLATSPTSNLLLAISLRLRPFVIVSSVRCAVAALLSAGPIVCDAPVATVGWNVVCRPVKNDDRPFPVRPSICST